jgi:hypothetical protein
MLVCLGLCACNVGKGVGAAKGTLYEIGCSTQTGDYYRWPDGTSATADRPGPFDLQPSFFAGEPIDDLREYSAGNEIMNNRIIIRLQRSGKEIEQNDVLTFDVSSSYEVARCVRGRVDNVTGQNDWDESNCFRASDNAPGRMRVQWDGFVNGTLALKATCNANLVGDAIAGPITSDSASVPTPVLDGNWQSWVEFQEFGGASEWDKAPAERAKIEPKFRVQLGQRIYASTFFLTLTDDKLVYAAIHDLPQPRSQIGGVLGGDPTTGRFDFDLERGQGAQFFP